MCALSFGIYMGMEVGEISGGFRGVRLFLFAETTWLFFPLAAAVVTGLLIGEDFSRGTIKNVLAVGTGRRDYYFTRLGVQMALEAAAFLLGAAGYVLYCLFCSREESGETIERMGVKLAVYMAVALLQMLAYVSMLNALCYFLKKQLAAMVTGMALVYGEAVMKQLVAAGGLDLLVRAAEYTPVRVLSGMSDYGVNDQIFTIGFLRFGISALLIILVSSIAGYVKFEYFPGEL